VTVAALFLAFLKMGLSGFGGVLPWARRVLVEERGWLTEQEFAETLSLCQFLPGPNIVNVSIHVGARFRGALGSLAAVSGLMLAPCAIVIGLGVLYSRYGQIGPVQDAIGGVAAAAAGLVVAMGIKMAKPIVRRPAAVAFCVASFVAVGMLQWPLILVLLALAPLGVAAAFAEAAWGRRRRRMAAAEQGRAAQ
jgi:chromate transporter